MRNEIADFFRHDGPFTSVYLDAQSGSTAPWPIALTSAATHWPSSLPAASARHPHPARLIDVCLRAAYGTSAEVRVVPSAVITDGLAALLRG